MSSSSKNSIRSLRSKNLKRENCCPNLNNLSISNSKTSRHLHSVAQSNSSTTPVYPNGLNPNLVDEIPEPLNVSKQTKFLDLKNKNLTFLPAWLIKYRNLTHLDLSNNCLTLNEHDINILRFCGRNLEQLNLNKNKIKNLSLRFDNLQNRPNLPMLFGSVLRNLKFLDLSSNKITDFEAVTGCQNLEKLQLSGNEIEFLPENLNLMKNLVYLYLGFNKMTFLSDAISNLRKNGGGFVCERTYFDL